MKKLAYEKKKSALKAIRFVSKNINSIKFYIQGTFWMHLAYGIRISRQLGWRHRTAHTLLKQTSEEWILNALPYWGSNWVLNDRQAFASCSWAPGQMISDRSAGERHTTVEWFQPSLKATRWAFRHMNSANRLRNFLTLCSNTNIPCIYVFIIAIKYGKIVIY